MKFNSELVIMDCIADTAEEAIFQLCAKMKAQGMVKDTYCQAVIEREREYPTGVPTAYYDVAIPHSQSDHVLIPGIAVAKMRKSVQFYSMGAEDEPLQAEVVILLAVKDPESQLNMLRSLMGLFEEESAMLTIREATDATTIYEAIRKQGIMDEV